MICVSIGHDRQRDMIAEHRSLVDQGVTLVELRLDYIAGEANLRQLLAERPSAVIVACHRAVDGGKFGGSEQERLSLLRTAIAEDVEYVDLEHDIAASIPRLGQTKRIVSFYDFHKTPDQLDDIHRRLCARSRHRQNLHDGQPTAR